MSYSELINKIESNGFEAIIINTIEEVEAANNEVAKIKKQLQQAELNVALYVKDIQYLMKYMADHCDKYILENCGTVYTAFFIKDDILYNIIYSDESAKWNIRKINVINP